MPLENPVLMKEMRSRMRGGRAYWILFVYDGLLCLALFFLYLAWSTSFASSDWAQEAPRFGSDLFSWMIGLQTALALLLAPAFTCGAITLEREQRTFELLCLTLVRPNSIFFGKLTSALSYVVLLAISSVPLVALCFLFGGVSPGELAAAYTVILTSAFFFGIVGLCCSTIVQRTTTATAMAYGVVAFFAAGTLLLDLALWELVRPFPSGPGNHFVFLYLNPIAAIISVRDPMMTGPVSVAPLWAYMVTAYVIVGMLLPFAVLQRLKP